MLKRTNDKSVISYVLTHLREEDKQELIAMYLEKWKEKTLKTLAKREFFVLYGLDDKKRNVPIAIGDVEADIKEKSNAKLLNIAYVVKEEYEVDPTISLAGLTEKYEIKEINVVNSDGLIIDSTELDFTETEWSFELENLGNVYEKLVALELDVNKLLEYIKNH